MASRTSGSQTALRRLMTEYKQLTANGSSLPFYSVWNEDFSLTMRVGGHYRFTRWNVHRWYEPQNFLFPTSYPQSESTHPPSTPLLFRPNIRIRLLHMGGTHLRSQRHALCTCFCIKFSHSHLGAAHSVGLPLIRRTSI